MVRTIIGGQLARSLILIINSGVSVEVMESLTDLMSHSPQMQQKIYSHHTQKQEISLALDALAAISSKVLD